MNDPAVSIQRLSPSLEQDFLRFFEGTAFSDNPRWSSCYCQCFYEDHTVIKWSDRTATENRALACERIRRRSMEGYLAYIDGIPVGWCNAAPRRLLHALDSEPTADAERVGTILCFLVDPSLRGRGIARQLLDAACDGLRSQGLAIAEANPRTSPRSAAENHFGPLQMYLAAGFTIVKEDDDGSVWVRRQL
ncbi:GNAT family N-acetyltransferase [Piscinibacter sakaiensis]|uniref:GNAT family N-acetyltransferase n=1 Tax=Piscinibacter sakaiensis TaxID=1547922 RepID=UPI0006B5733C|nr:GNAT family N-acetyltransferase [Piscinibacter sakaiensis]